MGQVRLSLGFNIGENTGFYLIARERSLLLRSERKRERVEEEGGGEGGREWWFDAGVE